MERKYLFNTDKIKYILNKKNNCECILCAIKDRDNDVKSLELFRTEKMIVTVNLYPFNVGHLMVFPARHIEDLLDLTEEEVLDLHKVVTKSLKILKEEFKPAGFNLGYNMGEESGASIAHLHLHIVPRYKNEVGFLDVLAGNRVVVIDPEEVFFRLKKSFLK
jgi:ATP adenylyltransferase